MSTYLILPHLEIQKANALAAWGMMSLTPVMAATLMGTAFSHKTGIAVSGVMLIHHDVQFCGEQQLDKFKGNRNYWLRNIKGTSLFNAGDMAGKGSSSQVRDNAYQPNAFMDGTWSVVLKIGNEHEAPPKGPLLKKAIRFLHGGRLAGGQIVRHETPVVTDSLPGPEETPEAGDSQEFDRAIRSGFVVQDSTHLMSEKLQDTPRSQRLILLASGIDGDTEEGEGFTESHWRSPAILGHGLITPLSDNKASRGNKPHAFSEPMIGLVNLQSIRKLKEQKTDFNNLFWAPTWPQSDVFLVTQENTKAGISS